MVACWENMLKQQSQEVYVFKVSLAYYPLNDDFFSYSVSTRVTVLTWILGSSWLLSKWFIHWAISPSLLQDFFNYIYRFSENVLQIWAYSLPTTSPFITIPTFQFLPKQLRDYFFSSFFFFFSCPSSLICVCHWGLLWYVVILPKVTSFNETKQNKNKRNKKSRFFFFKPLLLQLLNAKSSSARFLRPFFSMFQQ